MTHALSHVLSRKAEVMLIAALLAVVGLIAAGSFAVFTARETSAQSTLTSLQGYAWSENIGWISMNGSGYSVNVLSNKTLSGYAWSENIGWIRFGGLSGFPGSGGNAAINDDDAMTGWARALAYAGGWDGWISLNCSNTGTCGTSNYGVQLGTESFPHTYAWGSDVIGWIDFDQVSFNAPCTPGYQCTSGADGREYQNQWCEIEETQACNVGYACEESGSTATCVTVPPEGSLTITPLIVRAGETVSVNWTTESAGSCSVTATNGDSWSGTSGARTSSALFFLTEYTLTCVPLAGGAAVVLDVVSVDVLPSIYES